MSQAFPNALIDDEKYEEAALWFINAYKQGIYGKYFLGYLSTIGEEQDVDIFALLQDAGNEKHVTDVFTAYWKDCRRFLEELLEDD